MCKRSLNLEVCQELVDFFVCGWHWKEHNETFCAYASGVFFKCSLAHCTHIVYRLILAVFESIVVNFFQKFLAAILMYATTTAGYPWQQETASGAKHACSHTQWVVNIWIASFQWLSGSVWLEDPGFQSRLDPPGSSVAWHDVGNWCFQYLTMLNLEL